MDVSAPKLTGRGGGPEPLWALQRVEGIPDRLLYKDRPRTGEAADSVMFLIHAEVTR